MRPKKTKKDSNHWIPRDYLRDRCGGFETVQFSGGTTRAYTANYIGNRFLLFDTADFGGVWSDWFLINLETMDFRVLECKTEEAHRQKNHNMTDGEQWLSEVFDERFCILVTEEDIEKILDNMIQPVL